MVRVWLGGLRLWIVACVLVVATPPVEAQQCVDYFKLMFEGMRDRLGVCDKRNKLLESFSDAASLEFYAPGSPDAPGDRRGKVYPGGPSLPFDPTYTEASAPDFKVLLPDRPDGRWRLNGDNVVFNCNMPLSPNPMPQNEAFLECARVYACGARAARCGLETARKTNTTNCPAISQACLATHPVPQGTSAPSQPSDAAAARRQQAVAQLSPQCRGELNSLLQGADTGDGGKASAAYGDLRAAQCDAQIRALAVAAGVELPERPMTPRAKNLLGNAINGDAGPVPDTAAAVALGGGSYNAGQVLEFGFALLNVLSGVAGVYAAMPGGAAARYGSNMGSIGNRAVSGTHGQGAPAYRAPPLHQSDITGTGR
jgi:hypothetical protein